MMNRVLTKSPLSWAAAAALTLSLALGGASGDASAEELRIEAELLVPPIVRLEITPAILAPPIPTAENLAAGFVDIVEPITLTIHSNCAWELCARSAGDVTDDASSSDRGPGRLFWRTAEQPFSELSDAWTPIASGESCVNGRRIRFMLRIPVSWTGTTPGNYELHVEYSLSPTSR